MLRCSTTASRVIVSPSASMKMSIGSPATMWRSRTPFSISCINPTSTTLCRARYLASSSAPDNSSSSSPSSSSSSSSLKWLDFEDGEAAFKNRTTSELVRAWTVFHVCAWTPVVRRARRLLALAEAVVGARAVTWVLRRTFFAHFCAGETQTELLPVIDRLRAAGVGAILDYAAEADLPPAPTTTNGNGAANAANAAKPQAQTQAQTADPFPYPSTPASPSGPPPPAEFFRPDKSLDRREGVVSARTYYYEDEAHCDANAEIFHSCINSAGMRPDGFAAIKVTALCPPVLLMRISHILEESRRLFRSLSEEGGDPLGKSHASVPYLSRMISRPNFIKVLGMLNVSLSPAEQADLFAAMDVDKNGVVDYVEWLESVQPNDATLHPFFCANGGSGGESTLLPKLNPREAQQMDNMVDRLERLAERAAAQRVHLMVDAEQTYFQPAIDHMVLNLQKKFNRDFPAIYNTYQCYLTNTAGRVDIDLARAERHGYHFAAKLVRGAYMVQERKRAAKFGYKDPIFPVIQDTHENYHRVMDAILRANVSRGAQVMVATHNERSVRFAVEKMHEYGIPRQRGGVYFGQLLGMCDHVSFSLGAEGYGVYKYVPYGPVREVLPYLIRRAEENGDLLGGAQKERRLIAHELRRRKLFF